MFEAPELGEGHGEARKVPQPVREEGPGFTRGTGGARRRWQHRGTARGAF